MSAMKAFRVWHDPISGEFYAGLMTRAPGGEWVCHGKRHVVTFDIYRLIDLAELRAEQASSAPVDCC